MTEERADAGTPGPIDPTNHDRLLNIYWSALRDENDGIVYGSGLLAVARAVCPEHHAVFDTRTHVAVPVGAIREAAESLQKVANGSISGNNHSHRPWAQKRADAIRSLLPTESEATR